MKEQTDGEIDSNHKEVIAKAVVTPSKTPLYQASNATRYQRQAIIGKIDDSGDRTLICYVAGREAPIDRDDTVALVDLLHNVTPKTDVDLLLHTPGGDVDAAEKLIGMIRRIVGTARLRVIVPDYAKSAGTLMVLGADEVVMSDTSELGPIDPQILLADGNGNQHWHSAQNYIDAYRTHSASLAEDPDDQTARLMLAKLDPVKLKLFEAAMDRARKSGEELLRHGMFRETGNWSLTVSELLNLERFKSHAQMITWEDAQDKKIGLKVEYLDPKSPEWAEYWQLYCLQRLAITNEQKLFESHRASLLI